MKFDFSHKVDPETKNFKMIIEGDKEFNDVLNKSAMFLNNLLDTFLTQIMEINKKKKKPLIPTEITNVKTINADGIIVQMIFEANPDTLDRFIVIKDEQDNAIGLQIK